MTFLDADGNIEDATPDEADRLLERVRAKALFHRREIERIEALYEDFEERAEETEFNRARLEELEALSRELGWVEPEDEEQLQ